MSHEPWTLFWPRSGLTPTPSRPTLPVAIARFAMHITIVDALAVLGDAEAVVDGAVAGLRVQPRRRTHQLGRARLWIDAVLSGELRSSATKVFHLSYESISQRSAT